MIGFYVCGTPKSLVKETSQRKFYDRGSKEERCSTRNLGSSRGLDRVRSNVSQEDSEWERRRGNPTVVDAEVSTDPEITRGLVREEGGLGEGREWGWRSVRFRWVGIV